MLDANYISARSYVRHIIMRLKRPAGQFQNDEDTIQTPNTFENRNVIRYSPSLKSAEE